MTTIKNTDIQSLQENFSSSLKSPSLKGDEIKNENAEKLFLEKNQPLLFSSSGGIAGELSCLGLSLDENTLRLVSFFFQSGLKIDAEAIKKAKTFALYFPLREKEAEEAALILLSKGLEPSEKLIKHMLSLYENKRQEEKGEGVFFKRDFSEKKEDGRNQGEFESQGGNEDKKEMNYGGESPQDKENSKKNDFSRNDFPEKNIKGLFSSAFPEKEGLLALINSSAGEKKHCFFIPYEWHCGEKKWNGLFTFFTDRESGNTEKILNRMSCDEKKLNFVLYFNLGCPCALDYFVQGESSLYSEELGRSLETFFSSSGWNVKIQNNQYSEIEGLCTCRGKKIDFIDKKV